MSKKLPDGVTQADIDRAIDERVDGFYICQGCGSRTPFDERCCGSATEDFDDDDHYDGACDDDDCLDCRAREAKLTAEAYCDAQVAYYAKGGFFDTIFDGAFDE